MVDQPSFDIFNHYRIHKILATKEMSSTYVASAIEHAQYQVVIKIFNRTCIRGLQDYKKSRPYIKTLLSLHHQRIVPLLDVVFNETQLYLVSMYLPHSSLRERLQNLPSKQLPWEEALIVILQIGQALVYAHSQGIIHGDIKPENILHKDKGEIMLTDFSLAPAINLLTPVTPTGLHTPQYMAPEQFMGTTSHLSDQYALACLAYELLTGHPPFEAQRYTSLWNKHANEDPAPLSPLVPHIPTFIAQAILKALTKEPQQRHPDMSTFLLALEHGSNLLSPHTVATLEMDRVSYAVEINTSLLHPPAMHASKIQHDRSVHTGTLCEQPLVIPTSSAVTERINLPGSPEQTINTSITANSIHRGQTPAAMVAGAAAPPITLSSKDTSFPFSPIGKRFHQPLLWMVLLLVGATITFSLVLFSPLIKSSETGTAIAAKSGQIHTSSRTGEPSRQPKHAPASQAVSTASSTGRFPTPTTSAVRFSLRIKAGGNGVRDFISDADYNDPTLTACIGTNHTIDTHLVPDPAPQAVYQLNRCAPSFTYDIPRLLPKSRYTVRLHFAETYWTRRGQRIFAVSINGQPGLTHFDIVAATGARYRAIVEQFPIISTGDGHITIAFSAIRDNALLSGLEVVSGS